VNTKTFIATTGQGIERASLRADDQWEVESLLSECDVRCLAAHPLDKNVVYAGTQGSGVLRSNNAGKTWQLAGLPDHSVTALAVSSLEPGTIFAGTKPALLFASRDGGATWTELAGFRHIPFRRLWFSPAEPPFIASVQAIALSPTDPQVIVVGIEAGAVVRSDDGGTTWTGHRPGAVRDCHSLIFHSTSGDWVYESGGTGVAFSRNGGMTWTQPRAGLDRRYGWACATDPAQPEIWYVSASPMFLLSHGGVPAAHVDGKANAYIFRSAGGAAWQKLGGGLPQPLHYMAYALITDPAAPGHLYAGLSNGEVWHSTDYGDTWRCLPFQLKSIHRSLIMV